MSAPDPIPPADPRAGYLAHRAEIDAAIAKALAGGTYILGSEVRAFEREWAAYLGVSDAIGVGSGTDAIELALRACGIGPGDEVITVSHTAVGTIAAIELTGATPVLVDIDLDTYTLDPALLEQALTSRTRAVLPVHLYGQPADLGAIRELAARNGLLVIEDCAQSHGAKWNGVKTGGCGDIAAFSFYPTKNLGAFGDAGAVVTSRADLAEKARLLREYGWRERYVSQVPGMNTRLDEIQAAVLRVKLAHLDLGNTRRRELATLYRDSLADLGLALPGTRRGAEHVFHQFVVRHADRDSLREKLKAQGIGTLVHYPVPVHLQPAYRGRLRAAGSLERTEEAAATILSLPMFPELALDQARRVAIAIGGWARTVRA